MLAETIFWIAAVGCLVAEIAILRSTFAARRATKSELVPAASRTGELVWAFLPAVALSVVLVVTWQRIEARQNHMHTMEHSQMDHTMPMPSSPTPQR
jgi:heme/copper-type cytochrome/quinol oxidase subunit 2